MTLLLGLDIGTTSIKAVLYDAARGMVARTAARLTPVAHPQPGWSEHDALELWRTTSACIREAAAGEPVTALAVSSMAEAGVLVDRAGQPLSPVIAWYDRRSEPQAAWVEQQITVNDLYRITGQRASPSFGVTKLLWLRDHLPGAYAQGARWLPVPAYILYCLSGEMAVDYTIAARTLLFDQPRLDWSPELLRRFDLPPGLFPRAAVGGTPVGRVSARAAAETGLPAGAVCALGGHDHLCAALATGAYSGGAVTDSSGSASALLMLAPRFLPDPQLAGRGFASYAYVLPGLYAVKGGLKAAGSAVEWLARQLSGPGARPDYPRLEAAAAQGVARRAGPLWLPHLIGSGTPQGDRHSRAALVGAQAEHEAGDLFRGLLESLALWTRHNLEEMQRLTGLEIGEINLTGGVTRLRLLSQLKASALDHPVRVPSVPEAAACGAALLAGLGAGIFDSPAEAAGSLCYSSDQIDPLPEQVIWYDRLYHEVYLPLYDALKPAHAALERLNREGI